MDVAGIFSSIAAAMGIISRAYCRQAHSWLTLSPCHDVKQRDPHKHAALEE